MDDLCKVYVEPTNKCNLNCRTCVRNVWHESLGDMTWETYEALVEGLKHFPTAHTMAFAGLGEPLLHPQFPQMVRAAHDCGWRTEVTTNALLLTPDLVRELLDAGLDQLVVSIDGATAGSFGDVRPGASLQRVIENVQFFWSLYETSILPPLRIGIEFVAMKSNIGDLPELHRVARRIGASFILISNVLPYTEALVDEVLYRATATSYGGTGSPWMPTWILPRMDLNASTQEPLTRVLCSQNNLSFLDCSVNARNNYCPFVNAGAFAVSWDGGISPCPPLLHSYSCYVMGRQKEIRRYQVGRLSEAPLDSIWSDPAYVAFRQRVRDFDFPPCTDCNCDLAERNEEDCFGNPFPVCGDCLWARGIIRCA